MESENTTTDVLSVEEGIKNEEIITNNLSLEVPKEESNTCDMTLCENIKEKENTINLTETKELEEIRIESVDVTNQTETNQSKNNITLGITIKKIRDLMSYYTSCSSTKKQDIKNEPK